MNTGTFKTIVEEALILLKGADTITNENTNLIVDFDKVQSDMNTITITKAGNLPTHPVVVLYYWATADGVGYKSYYRFDSNGLFSDEQEVLDFIRK